MGRQAGCRGDDYQALPAGATARSDQAYRLTTALPAGPAITAKYTTDAASSKPRFCALQVPPETWFFASADAQVITASSGKQAVDKAIKENPDIIFMDIVTDDLDGYGACREIKQNADTRDTPIVFVTSKSSRADKLWTDKRGAAALVTKPFQVEDLLDHIRRIA